MIRYGFGSNMDQQAFDLLMDKLKTQDQRFDEVDDKLDDLLKWKWKLAGATVVISGIGGILVQILIAKLGG